MANPRSNRSKHRKPRRKGWDPLADWYHGMVGENGSKFQQKLAIPAVKELLAPQAKELILDVGCGQGVLAPHIIKAGAVYTGFDLSQKLISRANQRKLKTAEFLIGDASKPNPNVEANGPFDAAVFLLSIQDMQDLESVIVNTTRMLKPESRIVMLMLHPAFRIPRQSGWGFDEKRKLRYRRIDSYLSEMAVPLKQYSGGQGVSISHHRPLQNYINTLSEQGFKLDRMLEIPATALGESKDKPTRRAVEEIPIFLGIRAVR